MTGRRHGFTEGPTGIYSMRSSGMTKAPFGRFRPCSTQAQNEAYVIKHSPQHGWRVYDKLDETRPIDDTQPMRRPRE